MGDTNIEWADRVWNPIRGCSRVSAGCMHCYAEVMAARFAKQWGTPEIVRPDGGWSGVLSLVESKLTEPLRWRAPQKVFVNSMSDLFHEKVPDEWIDQVFAVMALAPQHTFQVLTKRPERMRAYLSADLRERVSMASLRLGRLWDDADTVVDSVLDAIERGPLPNVWLGVSVEDADHRDRIDVLRRTPAALRFISFEPLLGDLRDMDLRGIAWAIFGGESGPKARLCDAAWIRSGMATCRHYGTAVFVKQLGARPTCCACGGSGGIEVADDLVNPCDECDGKAPNWKRLRDRKGGDMEQWPQDLRVRQFPAVSA